MKDVEVLETKFDMDAMANNVLFEELLNKIGDNESLYACMTYGLKPFTVITFAALNYAYNIRENVEVECIVYGERDWKTERGELLDMTSLFYTNIMLTRFAELGEKDPVALLREMRED